jgi:hypothetical protein
VKTSEKDEMEDMKTVMLRPIEKETIGLRTRLETMKPVVNSALATAKKFVKMSSTLRGMV